MKKNEKRVEKKRFNRIFGTKSTLFLSFLPSLPVKAYPPFASQTCKARVRRTMPVRTDARANP